ncbi:MAG: nuclear transport factor 2 family protein [bacterium]|nr:nuclear transport factor 2 family protein [bacterium]
MMRRDHSGSACLLLLVGLLLAPAHGAEATSEVADVLDRLHRAAADADGEAYFDLFTSDAVFLGTAAEERWTIEEFQAFAQPYFSAGRGWTYVVRQGGRNVVVSRGGDVAWFDEVLDNEKYGECRGTGVLRRIGDRWKIAQYNLTIPVPNEIALDVVGMIRALDDRDAESGGSDERP